MLSSPSSALPSGLIPYVWTQEIKHRLGVTDFLIISGPLTKTRPTKPRKSFYLQTEMLIFKNTAETNPPEQGRALWPLCLASWSKWGCFGTYKAACARQNSAGFGSCCHHRSMTPGCSCVPNHCLTYGWGRRDQHSPALQWQQNFCKIFHVTLKLGWIHWTIFFLC